MEHGKTEWFTSSDGVLFIRYVSGWEPVIRTTGDEEWLGTKLRKMVKEGHDELEEWLKDEVQ